MLNITNHQENATKTIKRSFPGAEAVKTLHSQCRGPGLDPWPVETKSSQARLQLEILSAMTKDPSRFNKKNPACRNEDQRS